MAATKRKRRRQREVARQIEHLGIEEIWATSGTRGAGIRVAVLDTPVGQVEGLPAERVAAVNVDGTPALPVANSHGTCCASVIASEKAGAEGVVPEAEILSIRVTLGSAPDEALVRQAIALALQRGCDVISCSFTLPECGAELQDLVQSAFLAGVPVIAAAGNDALAQVVFPDAAQRAIVIGAVDRAHAPLTCRFNKWTDLFSLGDELDVVTPQGVRPWQGRTSGATALVAGVVALGLASLAPARRKRFGQAIEAALRATAVVHAAPPGTGIDSVLRVDPAAFVNVLQTLSSSGDPP